MLNDTDEDEMSVSREVISDTNILAPEPDSASVNETNSDHQQKPAMKKTKEKIYQCTKCQKRFAQFASAQKHCRAKKLAGGAAELTCAICGSKVKHRRNLKRHISEVHMKNKKEKDTSIPTCDLCNNMCNYVAMFLLWTRLFQVNKLVAK